MFELTLGARQAGCGTVACEAHIVMDTWDNPHGHVAYGLFMCSKSSVGMLVHMFSWYVHTYVFPYLIELCLMFS